MGHIAALCGGVNNGLWQERAESGLDRSPLVFWATKAQWAAHLTSDNAFLQVLQPDTRVCSEQPLVIWYYEAFRSSE